jgi:hypothetical protein
MRFECRFLVLLERLWSLARVHIRGMLCIRLLSCALEPLLLDHLEFSQLNLFLALFLLQLFVPQLLELSSFGLCYVLGSKVKGEMLVVSKVHRRGLFSMQV